MVKVKSIIFYCFVLLSLVVIGSCLCVDNPCNDGEFCNGSEICKANGGIVVCEEGTPPCDEGFCDEELDQCITEQFLNLAITVTIDFSNMTTTGDCTGISFPSTWSDTFTIETESGTITISQPSTKQECIGTIDSEGKYDCEAQQGQITYGYSGHLNEDGTGTGETFHMEDNCTFTWTGQKNPQ